jgi:Fic family protein
MAKVVRRRWLAIAAEGLPRRDRRSCEYEAYIPDPLTDRRITLDGDVAADVTDAETAVARLDTEAGALVDTEALARLLLRAEAVASSKIEGLEVGARRLLRAQAARELGEAPSDVTAAEVLGNIDAMVFAIQAVGPGSDITLELLSEVHRRLLAGTRLEAHGGRFRTEQNWIGGSSYNPCSAAFIPPPPESVAGLMRDLCTFSNDDSLPAVAQAAIAHAQFETIHPFSDGNGRTGRALIHLILKRRGLANRALPPVSLILATWSRDYIRGLMAYRYRGPASSKEAHANINRWVGLFATACRRAVEDARSFEERSREIQNAWRARLRRVRAQSATDLLLRALPGAPIITVKGAAELLQRSVQATNEAVARLIDAEVLTQVNVGKRNRAFEARDIIRAFTDLERQLASPVGDTRLSEPSRRVPHRPTVRGRPL